MIRQAFRALVPAVLVTGVLFPAVGAMETASAAGFQNDQSSVSGVPANGLAAGVALKRDFAPYPTMLEMSKRTQGSRQQQRFPSADAFRATNPAAARQQAVHRVQYSAPGSNAATRPTMMRVASQTSPARLMRLPNARPISRSAAPGNTGSAEQPEEGASANDGSDVSPWGAYPQLDAPLYPVPRPDVPVGVGATVITNPALAPHEMLYPHTYRSMYPPYFYRVRGVWCWTPVGMKSYEKWELQGTEVEVKYKSRFGLFSGFVPPKVGGR